jgi:hypothetical protein
MNLSIIIQLIVLFIVLYMFYIGYKNGVSSSKTIISGIIIICLLLVLWYVPLDTIDTPKIKVI